MTKLFVVVALVAAAALAGCKPAEPPKHDYNNPATSSNPNDR